ncbi:MAG: chemotaxis protein CheW [Desertifilum sp.]|nr:chemotaxis protein CheW [Oscillatoria laete-virens]MCD8489541.1 chemotaxis protein CheW [Desertifilum sp.]MDL5052914.1 chemotaxis protein CheW [Oscillatoria laete-virens NRMC-F 0139]
MEAQPFLMFRINSALYGIDALYVEEIFFLPELTPIAEVSADIAGAINWRGEIVPIIDLLTRLGQTGQPYSLNDSIIMLKKQNDCLGIIVNQVCDVSMIETSQIASTASYRRSGTPDPAGSATYFVEGIAQVNTDLMMLLDADRLLQYRESIAPTHLFNGDSGELPAVSHPKPLRFQEFTPQQLEVLRQRAENLRHEVSSQDLSGLLPIAVIGLNGEYFGLDLEIVCEFTEINQIAPIPCCPPHIVGNINLRGEILTLIDIRMFLNLDPASKQKITKAIVVEVEEILAGIIVDEVCDVMYLLPAQIKPVPAAVQSQDEQFLRGTVRYRSQMMSLLDLAKILLQERLVVNSEL